MIPIKTPEEIEVMRRAGQILAGIMKMIVLRVRENISTLELDQVAEELILKAGAEPAFKGYKDKGRIYPATLCTSVNNQVVHAIPQKDQILKMGDIVGLDCGLKYQDYYSDMAVTISVGRPSPQTKKLIKVTKKSLERGIRIIKLGIRLGDLSWAIQSWIEKNGFSVVRQLGGHGIGRELHEEPSILNYGEKQTGPVLKEGMVLAIEPMVNVGGWRVKTLDDGWTVVTEDGSLSAHFEHTILVTRHGAEILTRI